jgi:hypothetical protein
VLVEDIEMMDVMEDGHIMVWSMFNIMEFHLNLLIHIQQKMVNVNHIVQYLKIQVNLEFNIIVNRL